jgi:hypothetical protein
MFSLIYPNNQEKFVDIKGVIRSRNSKKDRQYKVLLHQLCITGQNYFGQAIHCTQVSQVRVGFQDSIVKLNPLLLRQFIAVVDNLGGKI